MWIANTFAVGNSYGFVEPLESTGIFMIQTHVEHLISLLRAGTESPSIRRSVNRSIANSWDSLRWFLAIHFRFNGRRDTAFWRAAQSESDIGDVEPLVELYRRGAPLVHRNPRDIEPYRAALPLFYGLSGLDCLLLGQRVPTHLFPPVETETEWRQKRRLAEELASTALPMKTVLAHLHDQPESLVDHAEEFLGFYTL